MIGGSDRLDSSTGSSGFAANYYGLEFNWHLAVLVDELGDAAHALNLAVKGHVFTHAHDEVIARGYLFKESQDAGIKFLIVVLGQEELRGHSAPDGYLISPRLLHLRRGNRGHGCRAETLANVYACLQNKRYQPSHFPVNVNRRQLAL